MMHSYHPKCNISRIKKWDPIKKASRQIIKIHKILSKYSDHSKEMFYRSKLFINKKTLLKLNEISKKLMNTKCEIISKFSNQPGVFKQSLINFSTESVNNISSGKTKIGLKFEGLIQIFLL